MSVHPIASSSQVKARHTNCVLQHVNTAIGTWFVDVGLEFLLTDQALLWTTAGHQQILSQLLGISRESALAIMEDPRVFTKDISTHLLELSGFRADFTRYGNGFGVGPLFVTYAQAYQTDKQQTYHPEGSRFSKTLTAKRAIEGAPPPWCNSLLQVYDDAANHVDVATRFEVRVALPFVADTLDRVDISSLKRTMVCYTREMWW